MAFARRLRDLLSFREELVPGDFAEGRFAGVGAGPLSPDGRIDCGYPTPSRRSCCSTARLSIMVPDRSFRSRIGMRSTGPRSARLQDRAGPRLSSDTPSTSPTLPTIRFGQIIARWRSTMTFVPAGRPPSGIRKTSCWGRSPSITRGREARPTRNSSRSPRSPSMSRGRSCFIATRRAMGRPSNSPRSVRPCDWSATPRGEQTGQFTVAPAGTPSDLPQCSA